VFAIEVLVGERCGGPRRIRGAVTERDAVRRLLAALGLAAEPPRPGRLIRGRSRPPRRGCRRLCAARRVGFRAPARAPDACPCPMVWRGATVRARGKRT